MQKRWRIDNLSVAMELQLLVFANSTRHPPIDTFYYRNINYLANPKLTIPDTLLSKGLPLDPPLTFLVAKGLKGASSFYDTNGAFARPLLPRPVARCLRAKN